MIHASLALAGPRQLNTRFIERTLEACGGCVEAKRRVPGKNEITCKCGKKALDWKQ